MNMEKTLRTFWVCVDLESTGDDKMVCEPFCYKEKLCNKHTFFSGLRIEYDVDEPGSPAYLAFETWDLSEDELQPGYFPTGHLIALESIKNGFRAITGDDEGKTTYTFKKSKIDPFQAFLERHPDREEKKKQEDKLEDVRKVLASSTSVEC